MTPEEIERAFEIVLSNQANFEVQLEKTNRQIEETNRQLAETNRQAAETNKRLEIVAETQTEFIQVVTRHIESQGEINNSLRNAIRDLSSTVERYISDGRNGQA
jgi:vacuolar-type H+-ATPase subunit I/STV1